MLRNLLVLCIPLLFSLHIEAKECISLVISGGPHRPFWGELIRGSSEAAKELNIDIFMRGVNRDSKARSQRLTINYLTDTYRCNGVLLAPAGDGLLTIVKSLIDRGIAVTYIDRDIGGQRQSVVMSDNYQSGVFVAREMAQNLKTRKNIALFRLEKGIASTDQRELGFMDEAKKLGLNVVMDEYLGVETMGIKRITSEFLSAFPMIDGIFTPNGTTTETILDLVKVAEKNHHNRPIHIGFDESDEINSNLRENRLYGYMKQNPFSIGYQGVHLLYKVMHGEKYTPLINVPVTFVTKEDLK